MAPTANDLKSTQMILPSELVKFLTCWLSGKDAIGTQKQERLMQSLGQDLCRAATNSQWKLPKHILISVTLRHLFRSAMLTTLFNRLGHCESYSFSLEHETALANALQSSVGVLPPTIIRNPSLPSVFHSDFDNFDQNTAGGSVHTSHGIMLQEVGSLTATPTRVCCFHNYISTQQETLV
jgi:hypothetical protein